jgi:hypothetical protein
MLVGTAFFMVQTAQAGCGRYESLGRMSADLQSPSLDGEYSTYAAFSSGGLRSTAAKFIPATYRTVDDESPDWNSSGHRVPITGLWYFKYFSKGNLSAGIPDGAQIDGGNTIWFADGNEMTSSAVRAPDSGSICLGVWKRTGEWTYELNHIGLSWDPVKNVSAGPAFIKQHVVLDHDGDKYSGTFTITQFAADGKTVDIELKGVIEATRVTVDTDRQLP